MNRFMPAAKTFTLQRFMAMPNRPASTTDHHGDAAWPEEPPRFLPCACADPAASFPGAPRGRAGPSAPPPPNPAGLFPQSARVDQAIGLSQAQPMGIHPLPHLANRIHHACLARRIPGQVQAHRRAGSILKAAGELHLAPVLPDRPAKAMLRLEQRPEGSGPGGFSAGGHGCASAPCRGKLPAESASPPPSQRRFSCSNKAYDQPPHRAPQR